MDRFDNLVGDTPTYALQSPRRILYILETCSFLLRARLNRALYCILRKRFSVGTSVPRVPGELGVNNTLNGRDGER